MKTTALRLYGKRDLRLETFDLPEMQEDEILATVVTDSLCLSSWKEANLGENHKKVPDDVATNPSSSATSFAAIFWPWVKSGSTNSSRVSVM
jgi:Threonine dehydrogenase and related Zn-dependent dehydrogenases